MIKDTDAPTDFENLLTWTFKRNQVCFTGKINRSKRKVQCTVINSELYAKGFIKQVLLVFSGSSKKTANALLISPDLNVSTATCIYTYMAILYSA